MNKQEIIQRSETMVKSLNVLLTNLREKYDTHENNPVVQNLVSVEIKKFSEQLRIEEQFLKLLKSEVEK